MKTFLASGLLIFVLFMITTLSACVSHEDRCEQIAFKAMKTGVISRNAYQLNYIQKACEGSWDERGTSDWRSCALDAETGIEFLKCKQPPHIFQGFLNAEGK